MRAIFGLGNIGKKYENDRHNIGFMVVDALVKDICGDAKFSKSKSGILKYKWFEVEDSKVEVLKPLTLMNASGKAVVHVRGKHPELKVENMLVVHDELDLPLGEYKLQSGRGSAGHKGVANIIDIIGTKDFHRLRVGVGRPGNKKEVEGYVLSGFNKDEVRILKEQISNKIIPLIKDWIKS